MSTIKNTSLLGQFSSKLDNKNRVFLPASFRKILGRHLIITRGYEGSLLIVPPQSWERLTADVTRPPLIFGPSRETARFLLGNASAIELDKQGRLLVPLYLQKYSRLKSGLETVFLGLGQHLELWEKNSWETYQKTLDSKISSISERLVNG